MTKRTMTDERRIALMATAIANHCNCIAPHQVKVTVRKGDPERHQHDELVAILQATHSNILSDESLADITHELRDTGAVTRGSTCWVGVENPYLKISIVI
jgi:hypothetical protein